MYSSGKFVSIFYVVFRSFTGSVALRRCCATVRRFSRLDSSRSHPCTVSCSWASRSRAACSGERTSEGASACTCKCSKRLPVQCKALEYCFAVRPNNNNRRGPTACMTCTGDPLCLNIYLLKTPTFGHRTFYRPKSARDCGALQTSWHSAARPKTPLPRRLIRIAFHLHARLLHGKYINVYCICIIGTQELC